MRRNEKIIVDLKVKNYDTIRLKQLDTTELSFKILDNSLELQMQNLTAELIFKRPDKTVVIQGCDIQDNTVNVLLLEKCLRLSGNANIEIELKEGTDVVSSFLINVFIEKTSKEDIAANDTQLYIERMEKVIANLQKEADDLLKEITSNADSKITDIEQRYTAITDEIRELLSNYNELKIYIQNISNQINEIVDNKMDDYLLKKIDTATIPLPANTVISNGKELTLPLKYQVGNGSLELFLGTEKMILATDAEDGHYKEVR